MADRRPKDVTIKNWPSLESQGFKWCINLAWPREADPNNMTLRHLIALHRRHGKDNVLIGYPADHTGRPTQRLAASYRGAYIKRSQ